MSLQSLTLQWSQQHVQPRRKEEVDKDVPVHQGWGDLPCGTHAALHQEGSAQISHWGGSTCLLGCSPWISHWWDLFLDRGECYNIKGCIWPQSMTYLTSSTALGLSYYRIENSACQNKIKDISSLRSWELLHSLEHLQLAVGVEINMSLMFQR